MILFGRPKPKPSGVTIFNVLGEPIDHVEGVWDLSGASLKQRQWQHANLSGLSLDGADCEGINLLGAKLAGASFCRANLANAEISFANAHGANFQRADLRGTKLYKSETRLCKFDDAIMDADSDIPGLKVVGVGTVLG